MKKVITKIVSFCLVFIFIATTAVPCFASEVEVENAPSEKFISLCDALFTNKNQTRILNSSGNDITHEFCKKYIAEHNSGDYITLQNAVFENDYTISWDNPCNTPYITVNDTLNKNFYKILETKTMPVWKRFEMSYSLMCGYKFYDATGQIISYESPVLYDVYVNAGALFSGYADCVTTDAYLSNNKHTLNISVAFNLVFQMSDYWVPGVIQCEETFPLTGSASVTHQY